MARREPLIWLQLLGAAALPLEVLLALLLLAGADPGPVPGLERLLAWAIGGLAPAVLLWKCPANPFSLLLVQAPPRALTPAQRTLLAAPTLMPQLAGVLAALVLLPGLWWIDQAAALAGPMALLPEANRLVALLLTVPVLAVMVWQIQQLVQAAGLLLSPSDPASSHAPLTTEQIESQRLCMGLPLLLLAPLSPAEVPNSAPPASVAGVAVAIKPEQSAEEPQGSDLDQQVD